MRCLVTGHRGYIGTKLSAALENLGHEIMGIDRSDDHDIISVLAEAPSPDGRLRKQLEEFQPECIFHLAAIPRVAYSVEHPVEVMKNNILSTSMLLNFASKVGAKRVVYSSSSSVIGNGDGPESPYALSKLVPEIECKLYSKLYGLDTVCLRYFNVYSEDQKAEGPYATAIANFMQFIRDDKVPFITGDGEQKRDMAHVNDVVSANIFCMKHPKKFNGQIFDVGTGENISLNEIKEIINTYFPFAEFEHVKDRAGDVFSTKANMGPLAEIGWNPLIQVKEGIHDCFKNLKEELM
jgi:UDP-glucose 4-epimerase